MKSVHRIGWLALLVVATSAQAQAQVQAPAGYDVAAAFAQTDANKDGAIEIDEYYDRLVETYFHGDTDKNGTLDRAEYTKAVVLEEDFARVDIDSDGKITRQEYIRERLPLFQRADTDNSAGLSLDEVRAAFQRGAASAQ